MSRAKFKKTSRDDNMGCKRCKHYTGKTPVNVPNFACAMGEQLFRIYYCRAFELLL